MDLKSFFAQAECGFKSRPGHHRMSTLRTPNMVRIFTDKLSMSVAAAQHAATLIRELLDSKASVRLIAATGASQLSFLEELSREHSLDWSRVELFHLDE